MIVRANHAMNGISTYPFKVFGHSWQNTPLDVVSKGDIVIGNDVWIGNSATIMQGVHIGDGRSNARAIKTIVCYN